MEVARKWFARVTVDNAEVLEMSAPLVIVVEALGRTLSSVDSLLYRESSVKVELRPL